MKREQDFQNILTARKIGRLGRSKTSYWQYDLAADPEAVGEEVGRQIVEKLKQALDASRDRADKSGEQ